MVSKPCRQATFSASRISWKRAAPYSSRYPRAELASITQPNWKASVEDMRHQLDRLVFKGFVHDIDWEHLQQLPRYLKGIAVRIDKLRSAAARDQQQMLEIDPLVAAWTDRQREAERRGVVDERLEEIRWLLEELRVSLFAQQLGTPTPVSVKRIEARWRELGL